MALAGVRDVPMQFQVQDKMFAGDLQVPAHAVDPNQRFNFPNKGYAVPKQQMKRYIDVHMARKAKLPSPDKYLGHTQFVDPAGQRMTIYPYDRRTYIKRIMEASKHMPGAAHYNTTQYDEKRVKPPPNTIMNLKEDRYTLFDEVRHVKQMIPSFYNQIPIVSIQPIDSQSLTLIILHRIKLGREVRIARFAVRQQ